MNVLSKVMRIPTPSNPSVDTASLSRQMARLLDTFIKIPGTSIRVGLDPIIGLIPGVGDTISTLMGSVILAEALKRGLPARLVLRMGGNMLLNAAVGAIPVVGDLFSAWFHSNAKNYALLKAFMDGNPSPPTDPQSKWVAVGFIVFMLVLAGFAYLAFYLLFKLFHLAAGG
ncbi:MAG: conserved rane protein of unknown function [Verrucomicrobiales bacterium]|nr:conserved rane protein of unknown function [Verrucomicrobiales bacterium]